MTPIRDVSDRERQLQAEIDEWKARLEFSIEQRDEAKRKLAHFFAALVTEQEANEELTAERDALKPDAMRYRWLRDMAEAADWEMLGYQDPGQVDNAVDELMKEGAK